MARSVNMVVLIGNLTRDPQMRYTPKGTAVTTFSVATNRTWLGQDGKEQEQVDYHNVVAWNKLAETVNNILTKGRKVYVKGRLSNRSWDGQDGQKHYRTEVIAEEIIFLDYPRGQAVPKTEVGGNLTEEKNKAVEEIAAEEAAVKETTEEINEEDIPF